jgi:hypothetical protein
VSQSRYRSELSYVEALELLGARDSRALELASRLTDVPAGVATAATLGLVDFVGLRDEVVNWGQSVVGRFKSWVAGADRFSRSQLLCAAHAVIVITAFYEGLDEIVGESGLDLAAAELTREEQAALATDGPPPGRRHELVELLVATPLPMPAPERPYEQVVDELRELYALILKRLATFLSGLAAFEHAAEGVESELAQLQQSVASASLQRYDAMFRRLRADVPEFDLWVAMHDSQATRSAIARIPAALEEAGRREMAERGSELIRSYRARLERSVVEDGAIPDGVTSPTLGESFVSPRCRSNAVIWGDPGSEWWWRNPPTWPDAYAQVAGLVMRPGATRHPIVILAQPGGGKTSLLRVLAADLPQLGFLAVLVELRSVSATAPVQTQIEDAVYQQTGRRIEWPALGGCTGDALPIVLIDGLDELLQASSGDHADYLERVEEFQRREAELGRPVAAIVTARTVAGTRVRFPRGATVIRLEPFDDDNIADWLERWNRRTQPGLRAAGLEPLTVDRAVAHGQLAREPLLLLMLAIYHSGGNSVAPDDSSRARLYERILSEFARREIRKGAAAANEAETGERDIRRLSFVAAAMFVRGRQSIRDTDLDVDLRTLLGQAAGQPNAPPTARETVGRFFFVHESRALERTGRTEHMYEFLHATFGEFLFARLVVETLSDLAERRAYEATRPRASPIDPGLLHALLSFAPLTTRTPAVDFCRELLGELSPERRGAIGRLATELARDSLRAHPTWSFSSYAPVDLPVPGRHAAFSANLVVMALLAARHDQSTDVAQVAGSLGAWHSLALLWQSQLGEDGWRSLLNTLRVDMRGPVAIDDGAQYDIPNVDWTVRLETGNEVSLWESAPHFTDFYEEINTVSFAGSAFGDLVVPYDSPLSRVLRQLAFVGNNDTKDLVHAVAPLYEVGIGLGPNLVSKYAKAPLARALLWLRLAEVSAETSERRLETYWLLLTAAGKQRDPAPWMRIVWRQFVEDAPKLTPLYVLAIVLEAIRLDVVDAELCAAAQ